MRTEGWPFPVPLSLPQPMEYHRLLKRHFRLRALWFSEERWEREFRALPFEPYAPVRKQFGTLFRMVNRRRKLAGLPLISRECIKRMRSPVRPFDN